MSAVVFIYNILVSNGSFDTCYDGGRYFTPEHMRGELGTMTVLSSEWIVSIE